MALLFSLLSQLALWLGFAKDKGPEVVHEIVEDLDKVDHVAHKVEDVVDKAAGKSDAA